MTVDRHDLVLGAALMRQKMTGCFPDAVARQALQPCVIAPFPQAVAQHRVHFIDDLWSTSLQQQVLVTNFTPAGRREAEHQFATEIASGQLAVIWVPFDMSWCYKLLIRARTPRICLPLEIEIWPAMIETTRRAGVPLFLCNAQYSSKSMERDGRGFRIRQKIIARCAGAFVKSDIQKERFLAIGLQNVTVTGELRFDQPVPQEMIEAAKAVQPVLRAPDRQIITIASGVAKEEAIFITMIQTLRKQAHDRGEASPLFVYVPRAPERFQNVGDDLEASGLIVRRRSTLPSGHEGLTGFASDWSKGTDVLLGDSLGEMYFYLELADKVIVGGGFTDRGAHNIIEPLAVGKPVLVGPYTWVIEFPFVEAEEADVARSYTTPDALAAALTNDDHAPPERLAAFVAEHRGASDRILAGIDAVTQNNS